MSIGGKFLLTKLACHVIIQLSQGKGTEKKECDKRTPAPQAHGFNHGLGAANK